MRLASIALALAIAAGIGFWLLAGSDDGLAGLTGSADQQASGETAVQEPAQTARGAVKVLVVDSEAAPLENRETLRGVTEAARRVDVKAETEGLVISERRAKGASVSEGDMLCRLDMGERPAQLAEAKAKLAQAQADADASTQLSSRGFSAETKLAADLASLEAAKASVSRIERDIARTKIHAPFSGLLENDTADLGALLQPGSTCATIVTIDPIRVVGFAPERIVASLKVGQAATAQLVTGEMFEAEVTYVSRWADVETRTYRIEAEAPNPDGAIRDGMTASMTILLEEGHGHQLPASALTLDSEGRLGVRLAVEEPGSDGAPRFVARFAPVEVLNDNTEGVWVSGLPDKATVIVLGQEFVTDGARIEPHYSIKGDETAARADGA